MSPLLIGEAGKLSKFSIDRERNLAKLSAVSNAIANKLTADDAPVHNWYRFVLSYPPHLVRQYLSKFNINGGQRVLDPFCGTGTTVVECKKQSVESVGIESHPMSHFASRVKTSWQVPAQTLSLEANRVAAKALTELREKGINDEPGNGQRPKVGLRKFNPDEENIILANSISPLPLHKALVLRDHIRAADTRVRDHLLLAFAKSIVSDFSNLHFGPEVGVLPKAKADAAVIAPWLLRVEKMTDDIRGLAHVAETRSDVIRGDSRIVSGLVEEGSVSAVITSPPYPNEKDYTRTTRLESVFLGLIANKAELRAVKKGLMRSNTRNVYVDDDDHMHVEFSEDIRKIAEAIESRRIAMGKTSGFERLYARVTKLYFGGMARHFEDLKRVLEPGARLAYVVGDQASYLRIMIRTGTLISMIAERHGYRTLSIDLFRTRLATATREQLREEVVVLELPRHRRRRQSLPKRI